MSIRVGMRPMARPAMKAPLRLYCMDFTDLTEVDPNGDVTITADKVDISSLRRDSCAYTSGSYGADYFDEFEHQLDVKLTASDIRGILNVWMVCNHRGERFEAYYGELGALMVTFYRSDEGVYFLRLVEFHEGPAFTFDSYAISLDTVYYLVIAKSGTTATCKIYSDAERTTLLDTLTVTLTGVSAGAFRYFQTATSLNEIAWAARAVTGYAENLCRLGTAWPEPGAVPSFFTDDFDDNSINTDWWSALESGTASVTEQNQRLECSGGVAGNAAGLVSKYMHCLSEHSIEVDVLNDSRGSQELVICMSKTVNSLPYNEATWYRIMKYNQADMCYVQKRVGGGAVSTLYSGAWSGAGGSLKIAISGGTISFYEEDTLRASEAYALTYKAAYIYIISWGATGLVGMDYFNNFVFE